MYLRPWTLDSKQSSWHVPHIAALDIPLGAQSHPRPRHRLRTKTNVFPRSHQAAWQDYIQNHVVSNHAARTIQHFLAAAECSPEEADPMEAAHLPERAEVDTTWVDVATVDKLTQGVGFEYSKRSGPAVRQILEQWLPEPPPASQQWLVSPGLDELSPAVVEGTAHRAAQPLHADPVQWTYGTLTAQNAAAWLEHLQQNNTDQPRPNQEQIQFLQAVIDRCLFEQGEENSEATARSEPLRCFFHGVPGAGKSQTLKWIRTFFENVCGWEHQKEFVFLAPQNTQAALIQGMTLHSFADIRIKAKASDSSKVSGPDTFVQYQRLRWIIIDECSTVGLEVLGTLEKKITHATREKGTWKIRAAGTDAKPAAHRAAARRSHTTSVSGLTGEDRPFGGNNLIVTGDMWQFPPVKATAVFQNPFVTAESVQVRALQKFFWTRTAIGMNHLFELTTEQRCSDPWLSHVLQRARHGNMSHEVWCYLHGFPTIHPGSWDFATNTVQCGNAHCQALAAEWEASVADRPVTWDFRQSQECGACQRERSRRCLVGKNQQAPKFLYQPFVHGLNAAKYIAANLRARKVAALQGKTLLWVVAQDQPLFHIDSDNI